MDVTLMLLLHSLARSHYITLMEKATELDSQDLHYTRWHKGCHLKNSHAFSSQTEQVDKSDSPNSVTRTVIHSLSETAAFMAVYSDINIITSCFKSRHCLLQSLFD